MFYPMVASPKHRAKAPQVLASSTEKRHPITQCSNDGRAALTGFEQYTQGLGIVARQATPAPIVNRLNEAPAQFAAKPTRADKFKTLGAVTEGGSTPAHFRTWLVGDRERWERVIKAAGVKAE